METLENIGQKVKSTTQKLSSMNSTEKNNVLKRIAQEIVNYQKEILEANRIDE